MQTGSISSALEGVGAKLLRQVDLGGGLTIAQWRNFANSRLAYRDPGHHTVSLYLDGTVRRMDSGQTGIGSSGALCLLPADGDSAWHVLRDVYFCHIYISQGRFQRLAGEVFDRDSRTLTLPDLSFFSDGFIADIINRAILPNDWSESANRLLLAQAADLILLEVLRKNGPVRSSSLVLQGGLSPHVLKRIIQLIDADLAGDLSLDRLAAEAGLSSYHFARMFKLTTGQTPHRFVHERRLAVAYEFIRAGKASITEIAAACGFSTPAHFAASFKAKFGTSPSAIRV
ncbi:AraC family transcriptional regulator (plasmid) [Rhizobium sp. CC1099]|uniref:helix-turn-helix domain-containing protein n=1 Tax=unclassified Rhizobium TaxID=2613769 RepID=UPI000B6727D7|nr:MULTISPECIES: AraC family transcriptional regulator [unclassified Rhizobium]OWK22685.1 hypothetical protein AJ87_44000 [Rhizobium yanglingense]QPB23116.1 helix-turn-helix transcriptional regulator [Rhizobium sp. 007]WFU89768.1 AraC family transcriptional regulator [Rhizobium sp. CC1099]